MMKHEISLTTFIGWCTLLVVAKSTEISHPVIIVPGITGSGIEMKLNRSIVADKRCAQTTENYVLLWLDIKHVCPIACFADNIKLHYNATTGTTYNPPGVETRVSRNLVKTGENTYYFEKLIKVLEQHGYKRNVSLFVALYDWRRGPHESDYFCHQMEETVIKAYKNSGNKRVSLVGHSMGGPMTLMCLHRQPQSFKDKYIESFISLSGAFTGSFSAVSIFIQGVMRMIPGLKDYQPECTQDEWVIDIIKAWQDPAIQHLANTFPSIYWLFPSRIAWNESDVLVQMPKKNYSLANIQELFGDVNRPTEYEIYQKVLPYSLNFTAPGVEVYCLYGQNVSTLSSLEIKDPKHLPSGGVIEKKGDGDGTVNLNSLQSCKQWKSQQKEPFHEMAFRNVNHMGMTTDDSVIEFVLKALRVPK